MAFVAMPTYTLYIYAVELTVHCFFFSRMGKKKIKKIVQGTKK